MVILIFNTLEMKNFTIYIGTLMLLIIILYIIYSGVNFILNDYVNPCLIENPSDFDCWNLSNTIISLIITII